MLRQLIFLFTVAGFSIPSYGDTSISSCRTNAGCKELFSDLVTEKFRARFPPDKWEIFVHADTYSFGDGKATSHAIVGVVPIAREKFAYFPNQTSTHIVTTPRISSAYDKQDVERKTIRRAVELLMAGCAERKNCDLE